MAKFGCFGCSGCLLIVLAVLGLIVLVVVPVLPPFEENESIDAMLLPIVCQTGETILRDQYSEPAREGGTAYSMNVYCIDKDEERRDETGRWVIISMLIFGAPFGLGMLMIIGGAARGATKMATNIGTFAQPTSSPFSTGTASFSAGQPAQPQAGQTLSARLKQLDDARNQGLITPEEYDQMRQKILDEQT
jgi:hypothetical protein